MFLRALNIAGHDDSPLATLTLKATELLLDGQVSRGQWPGDEGKRQQVKRALCNIVAEDLSRDVDRADVSEPTACVSPLKPMLNPLENTHPSSLTCSRC